MTMGETTETSESDVGVPGEIAELLESRLADKSFDLPLLPEVATRVMTLCSSDDSDAAELSDVLHQDQAFAGHVLRVANSPVMMPKVPIVSLQQAVSRLGMSLISEIAMAISVQGRMFNVKGHMDLVRMLWKHSLTTGCFAKEIARARRRNVESAFLCGLLHDVGKPLVLENVAELERRRGEKYREIDLHAAMDAYHPRVGALLSEEWGLPRPVTEAIRYHHDFAQAPSFSEAAMVTDLADHVAHFALPTTRSVTEDEVRALDVVSELNFYTDDMDRLLGDTTMVERMVEATG